MRPGSNRIAVNALALCLLAMLIGGTLACTGAAALEVTYYYLPG